MSYASSDRCLAQLQDVEAIDYFLATALQQSLNSDSDMLFHLLLALHGSLRQGHSCLAINDVAGQWLWADMASDKSGYRFADAPALVALLESCHLHAEALKPLVFERERLYLRRYWTFETELADDLRARIQPQPLSSSQRVTARNTLGQLFPQAPINLPGETPTAVEPDWQAVAVANALGRRLSIISGGPGTGKTYTVTRLLATLQAVAEGSLRIAMTAPTGKAKQRLQESIAEAKGQLANSGLDAALLDSIPEDAQTLHRLLGVRPNSTWLRHHRNNPLAVDLLLIDEASMVDLPMMTRVLRALPASAQLILVGDANQLPSIAVGSLLSDLASIPHPGYSAATVAAIQDLSGYQMPGASSESQDYISFLHKSHRFDGKGGIGLLATEVISLAADSSWTRLQQARSEELLATSASQGQLTYIPPLKLEHWLERAVDYYYRHLATAADIESAFERLAQFRILVPTRVGQWGVEALNERIEALLARRNPSIKPGCHYHGRPIMITRNHPSLNVYNGDVGLIWRDDNGKLEARFVQEGGIRSINLGLLPEVESVYAMTIHKTQGSEFSHVAILLPEQPTKLLSPELLYTGITRAKAHCYIAAAESVWKRGLEKRTARNSGLKERLCF